MIRRGHIVWAKLDRSDRAVPFLVVSNDPRNHAMHSFLGVRITQRKKPVLPTIVKLGPDDPIEGRALCDEVILLWNDEVAGDAGVLSTATLDRVDTALRAALALT